MSTFDELFDSLREGVDIKPFKESKVLLVSELDEPSLKAGEFLYDEETETLYVGAGDLVEDKLMKMSWLIKAYSSVRHLPAPRVKSNVLVDMTKIIITADGSAKGANHYYYTHDYTINLPIITHPTSVRRVPILCNVTLEHSIEVPTINIESEVKLNYGE